MAEGRERDSEGGTDGRKRNNEGGRRDGREVVQTEQREIKATMTEERRGGRGVVR